MRNTDRGNILLMPSRILQIMALFVKPYKLFLCLSLETEAEKIKQKTANRKIKTIHYYCWNYTDGRDLKV